MTIMIHDQLYIISTSNMQPVRKSTYIRNHLTDSHYNYFCLPVIFLIMYLHFFVRRQECNIVVDGCKYACIPFYIMRHTYAELFVITLLCVLTDDESFLIFVDLYVTIENLCTKAIHVFTVML